MRRQRCTAQVVSFVVIGVCALAVPALAQDCPELVGRLPGRISAVAVEGDYAYLGGQTGLFVADVADPSAPHVVGEVGLPSVARGVAVENGFAYVADGDAGLRVIDVSTPSAPVEVGFADWGMDEVLDVAVSGGYAYILGRQRTFPGWADFLEVIDVSTPSAPLQVGSVAWGSGVSPNGVAVSGGYAYVTVFMDLINSDYSGIRVIDVSTPSTPVEVGSAYATAVFGRWQGIAVSDSYAYVAAGGDGFHVINVSTASAPVEVGSLGLDATDIAAGGGYAYVVGPEGLTVVDVSTPSAPIEAGFITTPSEAAAVAVSGGYGYLPMDSGLQVIDVGAPSAPVEVGLLAALDAGDVAVSGDYAYVAYYVAYPYYGRFFLGLRVVDVSAPFDPVDVGFIELDDLGEWGYMSVAVSGDYVYVLSTRCSDMGGCHGSLRVINVSVPSAPVEVGFLEAGYAYSVAVSGDYVYVAGGGLRVIDVSTPSAPVEVSFVATPGWGACDVAVLGDFAYVACADWEYGDGGLRVIDVSTPSAPVEVGFVGTPGSANGVAVGGHYAYIGYADYWNNEGGLQVIDVSTPSVPLEVGFVDTPGYANEIAVSDDFAYVRVGDDYGTTGLYVIDVSVPSAPVEAGYHSTLPSDFWFWEDPGGVAVSDGYVYFAAGEAGLYVFNECDPLADARECFIPAAAVAAGAQGAFFQTDVEVNNTGTEEAQVTFQWLPRGEDNSEPMQSEPITLAAGQSLRYENVLTVLFGLEPDSLGAIKMVASSESVIGMSRTYNSPEGETAGTFGQGLPAIRATEMIKRTERRRIIFLSEDTESRANVGCVNGSSEPVTINIELFNSEGESLEVKTMDLGPWSNNQINRVFRDYQPVNGYVDVWADSDDALYYCYGSMLDNGTSDPTTILPQVPSDDTTFIPATALAAGLEGSFFQTDVDLNNVGSTDLSYELLWLPRGEDNTEPIRSDMFSLAPGAGVRYANVLDEVFGLEADQVGALALEASGIDLLAMSRTYNLPSTKVAGTFGQELPGIPADRMITTGESKRIIFMNENDDVRSNVGCQNGSEQNVRVFIELFNSAGESLETKTMDLAPWSNNQITRVFRNYTPIEAGYVDVWTTTPGATIYCYGSVLDNATSDPTTVLPQ